MIWNFIFFYILKQGYMKLINKIYACFVQILANMCLTYSLNETVFIQCTCHFGLNLACFCFCIKKMAFHHYVHAILIGFSLCKLKTMQSHSFAVSVLPVVLIYIRLFWIKYNIVIAKFSQNPCRHLHVEVEEVLDISTCISYIYHTCTNYTS